MLLHVRRLCAVSCQNYQFILNITVLKANNELVYIGFASHRDLLKQFRPYGVSASPQIYFRQIHIV